MPLGLGGGRFGVPERGCAPLAQLLDRPAQTPRQQHAGERRHDDDAEGRGGQHPEGAADTVPALLSTTR